MVINSMVERERQDSQWAMLIEQDYDYDRPQRGDVLEATILDVGDNDIVVDLGAKRDGIILPGDLDRVDEAYREDLTVGDRIPVAVMKTWGRRDGILVSLNRGLQRQDWLRANDLLESGDVIEAEVIDQNRGGVLVSFGGIQGFVPNSHLTDVPRGARGKRLKEAKDALIGETLSLVVIEVNQRRRRLVLSERAASRRKREELLETLAEGDVRTGEVRNLVDFGAFVDLGGIDGLIHISELDWRHVNHPRDVLNVGDEVEVYVLSVDCERERIGLSRKRMLPDPWPQVTGELSAGDVVEGSVTSVVDFGAFVDIGMGVEGLVHVSEMPRGHDTRNELEAAQKVKVSVLEVDEWRRQIALSLSKAEASEEPEESPEPQEERELVAAVA